jgi:hypothetical protein
MITRTESRISIIYLEHEAPQVVIKIQKHQKEGYRITNFTGAKNGEQGFYILKRESKTGEL